MISIKEFLNELKLSPKQAACLICENYRKELPVSVERSLWRWSNLTPKTVKTLERYLDALGYELVIKKKQP